MKQPPKKGTKEHYFQVVNHMTDLMNKVANEHRASGYYGSLEGTFSRIADCKQRIRVAKSSLF